jgi:hypothetical protein
MIAHAEAQRRGEFLEFVDIRVMPSLMSGTLKLISSSTDCNKPGAKLV